MKLLRDQLEKERREARIATAAQRAELRESMPRETPNEEEMGEEDGDEGDGTMPGAGNVLGPGSSSSARHRSPSSDKNTD